MDGGRIFVDASANNKPPGIFGIYYLTFLLFGKYNIFAVRMMAFLFTLATALVLGILAYRIKGEVAALLAAVFYLCFTAVLYSTTPMSTGLMAANTEVFMVFPYTLAVLLLWFAEKKERGALYFLSGVVAVLAPLIKQVGGVEVAAVLLYLLLTPFWSGRKWRSVFKSCIAFGAGFVTPILLVALALSMYGVLDDAIFWCFTYPSRYISLGATNLGILQQIVWEFVPFSLAVVILWVLCGLWIKRTVCDSMGLNLDMDSVERRQSGFSLFLILWLLVSVAATLTGKRMYDHYFIQMLPPLCLTAALGGARYFIGTGRRRGVWKAAIITLTVLPGIVFTCMTLAVDSWDEIKPDFRPATDYIRAHTKPEDKIFVWGWYSPVYVYSQRTPATRFVFTTMLTGYKPGDDPDEQDRTDLLWAATPEAWPMLEADLQSNRPEMIIDTSPGDYHDFGRYPLRDYPVLRDYVDENCRLETTIAGMDLYRCARSGKKLTKIILKA
jgi:MFS family permease